MAADVTGPDRRAAARRPAAAFGLEHHAQLRPGTPVYVLNISPVGALVESVFPCRPGARTELHLDAPDGRRRRASGAILRCSVTSLSPLRFRTAVGFEAPVDLYGCEGSG
jgi:hypothetical protein